MIGGEENRIQNTEYRIQESRNIERNLDFELIFLSKSVLTPVFCFLYSVFPLLSLFFPSPISIQRVPSSL